MVILGIDTAIRKTGYGILDMNGSGNARLLDCGLIRNGASLPHSECLRRLAGGIRELVEKYHPEAASREAAVGSKNIKTAMILSLARGAVIATLAERGIPVYEYSPANAKRAATGRGDAPKEQVASLMSAVCGLDGNSGIPDDATDAIALAYCHGNRRLRAGGTSQTVKPI